MDTKHSAQTGEHPSWPMEAPVDPELPVYYNSEPSSQPPQYHPSNTTRPTRLQTPARPQPQHKGSGASAATIAAIMGPPLPESKEKKPLRERWRDWKERNLKSDGSPQDDYGSSNQWNVQGVGVKTWSSAKSRACRGR